MRRDHRAFTGIGFLVLLALVALAVFGRSGGQAVGSGPPKSAASGVPSGTSAASLPPSLTSPPTAALPVFDHVYLIVFENRELGSVLGNPDAPYLDQLAEADGVATRYSAVAHPSQPNYLALWSGSTQGVTSDRSRDFITGTTLADELESRARTWRVAAENVPLGCYRGATASGGPDGPGTYARKHEPAISWLSVSLSSNRCENITDLGHFDPAIADFWLIVPNLCHDMHDCPITTGDAWLKGFLPRIVDSPSFARSAIFITFDEGTSRIGGGGLVETLVVSPLVKPGFSSDVAHSHYSLLRTIEDAWSLPCLAQTCSANNLGEFFR